MSIIFERKIQVNIEKWLFKKKILILYGPRQVGKTTILKSILQKFPENSIYLNCEDILIKQNLENLSVEHLRRYLGTYKLVALDEAHLVVNIGKTLKMIYDELPGVQVIATGSSSFDLSNKINEPLTGRALEFNIFPLSLAEIKQGYNLFQLPTVVQNILKFGSYPEIVNAQGDQAPMLVRDLTNKYLFKDILEFEGIKNSDVMLKLLQALALQMGNEVSINELGNLLDISKNTVARLIDLLEKCFVIFRLKPYATNLRKEINTTRKIYFYDLGIRNSLINNFNEPDLRTDKGALWENFLLVERMKHNQVNDFQVNPYFWRTRSQQEIDYLEESGGRLKAYEFKWSEKKVKIPKDFSKAYPTSEFHFINQRNYLDFIGVI